MSENIVLLSSSPRKGGNTDKLAAAFVEGAQSAGKNVTPFRVADMDIGGCLGCGYCREKGSCIQKDDMPKILEALRKADALVLASPVYYFGVNAQLKLAIDRMYALSDEEKTVKRAALLMPCASGNSAVADGAVIMYERWLAYEKWENAGTVIAAGVHNPGGIEGREELEKARTLGREI